jgi:hypothetical protein
MSLALHGIYAIALINLLITNTIYCTYNCRMRKREIHMSVPVKFHPSFHCTSFVVNARREWKKNYLGIFFNAQGLNSVSIFSRGLLFFISPLLSFEPSMQYVSKYILNKKQVDSSAKFSYYIVWSGHETHVIL